ncbi:PREDICTED: galanin peptides [Mandrillus leucophaeus]|nr:PREDICTED: galanin peptides [Mandrillus leucophaeus]
MAADSIRGVSRRNAPGSGFTATGSNREDDPRQKRGERKQTPPVLLHTHILVARRVPIWPWVLLMSLTQGQETGAAVQGLLLSHQLPVRTPPNCRCAALRVLRVTPGLFQAHLPGRRQLSTRDCATSAAGRVPHSTRSSAGEWQNRSLGTGSRERLSSPPSTALEARAFAPAPAQASQGAGPGAARHSPGAPGPPSWGWLGLMDRPCRLPSGVSRAAEFSRLLQRWGLGREAAGSPQARDVVGGRQACSGARTPGGVVGVGALHSGDLGRGSRGSHAGRWGSVFRGWGLFRRVWGSLCGSGESLPRDEGGCPPLPPVMAQRTRAPAKEKRGWTLNSAGYLLGPHAVGNHRSFSDKNGLTSKRELQPQDDVKPGSFDRSMPENNIMRTIIEFLSFLHLKEAGAFDRLPDLPAAASSEDIERS